MAFILTVIFVAGYGAIAFEHAIKINKAATALVTATLCWTIYALLTPNREVAVEQLVAHMGEVSGILFFLMGAMTIVELIDAHDGFEIIRSRIKTTNKKKLVWLISMLTFFLSAVLDNLTTTIVMISLIRKLISDKQERLLFAGLIVIAANAGGAWSPIGDVTTTMLWIGGQITSGAIIGKTLLPSLVCACLPALVVASKVKGNVVPAGKVEENGNFTTNPGEGRIVLALGIVSLLFVPVFKTVTHLPPYMGILFGLGVLWIITEFIHSEKDEEEKGVLSVNHALRKIDSPSILFFLGILISVAALQSTGILSSFASWLNNTIGNVTAITICVGLLSAVVDNVPLVAAVQAMYPLDTFPTDHYFWQFLAYCTGTGGSALIIGSAAGVAAMGLEKIDFFWYVKKITLLALIGYFTGALVFILQDYFL